MEKESKRIAVGFAGYATSGKDTAAEALLKLGWEKMAFSDPLWEVALACNPWIKHGLPESGLTKFSKLRDLEHRIGRTKAKEIVEVRQFLQLLGTEGVRDVLDNDAWVKEIGRRVVNSVNNTAITGVRFHNEADFFNKNRYPLVWVHRPGVTSVNSHSSDSGLIRPFCNIFVVNDGTVEDLHERVLEALSPWL